MTQSWIYTHAVSLNITSVSATKPLKGFNDEEIHVYGHPSVHFAFKIPEDKRDVVEQVQIVPVPRRLICLGGRLLCTFHVVSSFSTVKGCMVVWSLDGIWMDKPLSIVDIPNTTRCMPEIPRPAVL